MTGKQRFDLIMARKSDTCGFWHGNVDEKAKPAMFEYLGCTDHYDMGIKLNDTIHWITADSAYKAPDGTAALNPYYKVNSHKNLGDSGFFADFTDDDLHRINEYPWPDLKHLDFTDTIAQVERANKDGFAVFSGMWACFYHVVADFFGMENYFAKMYTDPLIVQAVTEKVVEYYYGANELYFKQVGNKIDATFFGNDFGTQLDIMISPECFEKFVMPSFRVFTEQGKRYGHKVALHSCGSIFKVIPKLIDAGVDILHPLQAQAANMDAVTLNKHFGKDLTFLGAIDMQGTLTFGTAQEVRDEVRRVKSVLGTNFIVSPSHEHILPNVPPANIEAMALEAVL